MKCIFWVGVAWLSAAQVAQAEEFMLYVLAGQSNMTGYGYVKELPAELQQPQQGVMIFHGNIADDGEKVDGRGVWEPLQPGHGLGFTSDGEQNQHSGRFGLELSFAQELRRRHPDRRIALIKYAKGGTAIAQEAARHFGCWEADFDKGNGVNQFDHFLATLRNALTVRDIDGDGEEDQLVPAGILWMQGESDASFATSAARDYQENLGTMMNLMRAALRQDDLPVVVGLISNSSDASKLAQGAKPHRWRDGDRVREAQRAYTEADPNAALVAVTDELGYSDSHHYDSEGYLRLGRAFAERIEELAESD